VRREIRVRTSKTPRGWRTIPLLPQLEESVREWRAYRAEHDLDQPGSPFLVTMAGSPMQSRYVWRIVRDVSARAGLSTAGGRRVTPHALRRTFATEMLIRGVRLETVSRLLGHAARRSPSRPTHNSPTTGSGPRSNRRCPPVGTR
jgi:site-specific recombinase XerD